MPSIYVNEYWQDFAANGDATGKVQVADSSGYFVGGLGSVQRDDAEARAVIVSIVDSTHVIVRIIADDNEQQAAVQRYGGRSDLTGYTTAKHSRLSMEAQVVRVDQAFSVIKARNV